MDQTTIDTYNRMADEYDEETTDFWEKFPRTFLDQFIATSGVRILDIGSGPGRDGLLLQKAGKDVTCLDASEEMVRISSNHGLTSVVGDFMHLPFPDASFDGVWAYTSLLHVAKTDIGVALGEIKRVLNEGGIFGLGLIEGEGELYRQSSGMSLPRLFSYYSKEEVENVVRGYGFELVYFEAFKPGSKKYLNFIFRKV
ncbi:MAG: class I SAM-dependent methyltransferase [Candidatus Paceibacterota bacterium]|jgi:ubiquinone/menaquinone biosynthesis C-methylase UbiE